MAPRALVATLVMVTTPVAADRGNQLVQNRAIMYRGVDEIGDSIVDMIFWHVNGVIEKEKTHKYQPLELK